MTNEQLIKGIREYANANYESNGWDYIVECWEGSDIINCLIKDNLDPNTITLEKAISIIGETLKIQDDYRKDIFAEEF